MRNIKITNARTHNLKNISLEIEKEKITSISGISGSGKSSLAFDTVFAEGQRRYVDNLSSYAKQVIGALEKPDVDAIENIPPAISIDQKSVARSPRSTVGTLTEAYDYLRLLFARFGQPFCPVCGEKLFSGDKTKIPELTIEYIKLNFDLYKNQRLEVFAPVIENVFGSHQSVLNRFATSKYVSARIDGTNIDVRELSKIKLAKNTAHTIEILVGEIEFGGEFEKISDETLKILKRAIDLSGGSVIIQSTQERMKFSKEPYCEKCGQHYGELQPRLFSFNSPFGACLKCQGLGVSKEIIPELVIPNKKLTFEEGAIRPWTRLAGQGSSLMRSLEDFAKEKHFALDIPVEKLSDEVVKSVLFGEGDFAGVIAMLEKKYRETDSDYLRQEIENYMEEKTCDVCSGKRLNQFALAVKFLGLSIDEFCDMEAINLVDFFDKNMDKIPLQARGLVNELLRRIKNLISVGVEYLTLSRSSETLSGGEAQRIRLGAQFDSFLSGVLYVLDEPTISLHSADTEKLISSFKRLKNEGNTVLIVEHDKSVLMESDYIVDMGPGAGKLGGEIISQGKPSEILADSNSITGRYLSGTDEIKISRSRKKESGYIELVGANLNNLKNLNVKFPLGFFTCVTGVSGCGKSTLVFDVLAEAVSKKLNSGDDKIEGCCDIRGVENIDKIIKIDQSPIGRTPRSNLATYTGLFTPIRELFAQTSDAQAKSFSSSRFSFNLKGGRCETCHGDGYIKVEMYFLPDAYIKCEECAGNRYNSETLKIKYKEKNIAEILEMSVDEASDFFADQEEICQKLEVLKRVGLGYLPLGQNATTLSGGEAQRIKLSTELSKTSTGNTLYILDEPTTGLHFDDIKKLLQILHELVDRGNTVLMIEHNIDVINNSDWVIDMGPRGGSLGGEIIACGKPKDIKMCDRSITGKYL